jgi:hypothetical protein
MTKCKAANSEEHDKNNIEKKSRVAQYCSRDEGHSFKGHSNHFYSALCCLA